MIIIIINTKNTFFFLKKVPYPTYLIPIFYHHANSVYMNPLSMNADPAMKIVIVRICIKLNKREID